MLTAVTGWLPTVATSVVAVAVAVLCSGSVAPTMATSRQRSVAVAATAPVGLSTGIVASGAVSSWPTDPNTTWSWGNHRLVVTVPVNAPYSVIRATVPWRRRAHPDPTTTDIIVTTSEDQMAVVEACSTLAQNASTLDIVFAATEGPGDYFVYTMPFNWVDHLYSARVAYTMNTHCRAQPGWWLPPSESPQVLEQGARPPSPTPGVTVQEQSKLNFDEFTDSDKPATPNEVASLLGRSGTGEGPLFAVVPEDRSRPVRSLNTVPAAWVARSDAQLTSFSGVAQLGEVYPLQLGIVAGGDAIASASVTVSGLTPAGVNVTIVNTDSADAFGGVRGWPTTAPQGGVLPMWVTVQVPDAMPSGVSSISASMNVRVEGATTGKTETHSVALDLRVIGPAVDFGGDNDAWRGSRVRWLGSTLHQVGTVTQPFVPIQHTINSASGALGITVLGKHVTVGTSGLLSSVMIGGSIGSRQRPLVETSTTGVAPNATEMLAAPMQLTVTSSAGKVFSATVVQPTTVSQSADDSVSWTSKLSVSVSASANATATLTGVIDFTGFVDLSVSVSLAPPVSAATATPYASSVPVSNISVTVPVVAAASPMLMGLGLHGDLAPEAEVHFAWANASNMQHDEAVWMGGVEHGIRVRPRGNGDLWLASVPSDSRSPLAADAIGWNGGSNGAVGAKSGGVAVLYNGAKAARTIMMFTGPTSVPVVNGSVEPLALPFSVMPTPARPLNLTQHWTLRYAQSSGPSSGVTLQQMATAGVSIVNLHQGNDNNPWINYPYTPPVVKAIANETQAAHKLGMRFKIYNTMRELSNRAQEIWIMRALGDTYVAAAGGGAPWLQEHLSQDYGVAWSTPLPDGLLDAAIQVHGVSRWNNYYVEGLQYLLRATNMDGLYLDECAYGRTTMKRVRRALDAPSVLHSRGPALIDLHSDQGGFCQSPANGYMPLMSYIDSLWFGEGFDYDSATPHYWLLEMSGLPLGQTADMLRYHGMNLYPYRGLLFGSWMRYGCFMPEGDPSGIWHLLDTFDVAAAQMIGWWAGMEPGDAAKPAVSTNSSSVFATAYVQQGKRTLVVLASFTNLESVQREAGTAVTGRSGVSAGSAQPVALHIDWAALGLVAADCELVAPPVAPFQPTGATWAPTATLSVDQGWIFFVQPKALA